jgi:magnesium chelatase family protein
MVVRRYAEKISGPIRDRIDINQAYLPLRKAYLKKATLQRAEYLRRHLPLPDGLEVVDEAVDRGRRSARGVDATYSGRLLDPGAHG